MTRGQTDSQCCCKINGNYREVGLYGGLYSDTAEGNGFINTKLDTEQLREHITGCTEGPVKYAAAGLYMYVAQCIFTLVF